MNNVIISQRLQAVLDFIPHGSVLADIGTDHAYLPIAAVQQAVVAHVIGGEYNEGPYLSAQRNVASAGLNERIELRKGDGLQVLQAGEVNAISICGMGGALMCEILQVGASLGVLEKVTCIVLQPNVGEELVRKWARDQGWHVSQERWIEEDGRIYPILQCLPGAQESAQSGQCESDLVLSENIPAEIKLIMQQSSWRERLGDWNLKIPTAAWHKKWQLEWEKTNQILSKMQQSQSADVMQRAAQMRLENDQLAEVLRWVQPQA